MLVAAFVASGVPPVADARASAQFWRRPSSPITEATVRGHMEMLASDALAGRASGSRDEWIAATYVASQLRQWGLEPIGDEGGFVQTVDLAAASGAESTRATPVPQQTRGSAAPISRTWNVIARLAGSDRRQAGEIVLLSAHLDHLGTRGADGDAIFNGADDNASGVTAVLELARAIASGPRPRRTIVFAWFGSEERGALGSGHFVEHPPVPLDAIVANLQFEMIGRPDPAVPPGTLWLTGYERSTLGPELARRGARLVADPHPAQNFFFRSDNIRLAYRGVVAHTVSSFGLHRDYHTAGDDLTRIDFAHMTAAIRSMVGPVRWLAGSTFVPTWKAGMRPEPRRPGA